MTTLDTSGRSHQNDTQNFICKSNFTGEDLFRIEYSAKDGTYYYKPTNIPLIFKDKIVPDTSLITAIFNPAQYNRMPGVSSEIVELGFGKCVGKLLSKSGKKLTAAGSSPKAWFSTFLKTLAGLSAYFSIDAIIGLIGFLPFRSFQSKSSLDNIAADYKTWMELLTLIPFAYPKESVPSGMPEVSIKRAARTISNTGNFSDIADLNNLRNVYCSYLNQVGVMASLALPFDRLIGSLQNYFLNVTNNEEKAKAFICSVNLCSLDGLSEGLGLYVQNIASIGPKGRFDDITIGFSNTFGKPITHALIGLILGDCIVTTNSLMPDREVIGRIPSYSRLVNFIRNESIFTPNAESNTEISFDIALVWKMLQAVTMSRMYRLVNKVEFTIV